MFLTVNSTGDLFSGTYEFEVVNGKHAVISTGAGKVAGKLMTHPPLP
jgi:hypothetical protein